MSKNIDQVFIANPITTNIGTDLMYFGRSPYGVGNDAAMTYTNFSAQFAPVVNQTTSAVTMTSNNAYITNNGATLVTYTLPTTSAVGDYLEIVGSSAGGWTIAQGASQEIFVAATHTTIGAGGSLASVNANDCVRLRCSVANTTWVVMSQQSTGLTIV